MPSALSFGTLIAHDAPLLSPTDYHYSPTQDTFQYPPYSSYSDSSSSSSASVAESPVPTARMLKFPVNDSLHCVPTHQLFDFPQLSPSPSEPPSPVHHPRLSISINPVACKRSPSPEPSHPSKKRAAGERISSKDFVPPDVSGLSKREARLVKNRAAAFLSRQRKREEFELMEVRVAELEQENARLLAIAQGASPSSTPPRKKTEPNDALVSEVEQLRAQLRAAEERERELNAELTAKTASHDVPPVKIEPSEPSLPLSPAPRLQSPHKSAASLGLMVLLCALPSLLSMPSNSALPASFSLPHSSLPASSSAFDFNSFLPNEYDWSRTGNSVMDLDADDKRRVTATSATTTTRKLEFSEEESGALTGLGGLDISFDASPLDDGKIRVRIHNPSSSVSSRAPSPGGSYPTKQESSPFTMFLGSESETSASLLSEPYVRVGYPSSSGSDPFLGVGGYGPYSGSFSPTMYNQDDISSVDYSESDFGVASEYSVPDSTTGGRRRVRIALKSMPASGGEGGEWEVQFC
ncbi:hypothetical protein K438DRAFT_1908456 [Mycena galopus ATCC 62051]|nr:hypothetical protein K438DRAFT_1908456 [Mycena galopus ATCC 62051]